MLVACERSGVVRRAFRALGHDAWSCDLDEAEDGSAHHIEGDAIRTARTGRKRHVPGLYVDTVFDAWDLMIAHPPCAYLASSGLHWTKRGKRPLEETERAVEFVYQLCAAPVPHICIENPVGYLSRALRKPDQIIQPYEFGEDASKATCLWLKGLPPLKPTRRFPPRMVAVDDRGNYPRWGNQTDSGQNRLGPSETRGMDRARTYPGIARAMAAQWTAALAAAREGE